MLLKEQRNEETAQKKARWENDILGGKNCQDTQSDKQAAKYMMGIVEPIYFHWKTSF